MSAVAKLPRAWYAASIGEFLEASEDSVIGQLVTNSQFDVLSTQRDAWLEQITFLKARLVGITGSLFLEFSIPRMGRRIDAVLLIGPIVFVVEFKVGATSFDRAAIDQVWDYALDLKNFHGASHSVSIVPVLVATGATENDPIQFHAHDDDVYRPVQVAPAAFRDSIDRALLAVQGASIAQEPWEASPYRPTPTIVEAARALYAQHSVDAIARNDAGAQNLHVTSARVEELVDEAREKGRKLICFVTGVPGAGKTLVGLNVATQRREVNEPTHAVFLSGNGPLVAVLRAALARDEVARQKARGERTQRGVAEGAVKAFIQNVHHFRDEALAHAGPPDDHVVVFDEAQRAWDQAQTAAFMVRRRNLRGFAMSEPEFLIKYMDRHPDWAVVVCLVGGGQEINKGEAGIDAWLEAVKSKFPHWHMHVSSRLIDREYAAGHALLATREMKNAHLDDSLHLAVSMRSFRAETVSSFVKAVLDRDKGRARNEFTLLASRYPIAVTRDLDVAKRWIRDHARGTERFGLVASSKGQRLKPHAIDVRVEVDPVHWFLDDATDTRSSFYLEDAATEFQVQGLELDWACVTWDGDLRASGSEWTHHKFRGSGWQNVRKAQDKSYRLNSYRVLLTRARQGMVIFVPPGEASDPTRLPAFYDPTFDYLAEIGIPKLS